MLDWPVLLDSIVLLLFVGLGGALLAGRSGRFSFRGSTLLGFFFLALGMTAPHVLRLTRMMLVSGAGTDAYIGVWNLWWTATALGRGLNPLETGWIFHPNGTSLALHTFSFTYGLLSLPLQWILNAILGAPASLFAVYNLLVLASFTLSGYFVYRLALRESGCRGGSILAGIVFAFANYRFANTVRLHVLATEFLVLSVWACIAYLERPDARRLALWIGAYLLLLYASLEYAAYALLLFALPAVPAVRAWWRERGAREGGSSSARRILAQGAVALGGLVLLLPLLLQLRRRLSEGDTSFDPRMAAFFSADLLDFLLPNPRHPLWGGLFTRITAGFHDGDPGFGLSLGWIVLAVSAFSAVALQRARRGRIWFWGFVLFWVLSLGPVLHVAGTVTGLPLPQALLSKALPFLAGSRTPIRYMAPGLLCLAMTLAMGWAAWRERRRPAEGTRAGAFLLEPVLGGLILLELLAAPMPMARVEIPRVYREIQASSGSASGTAALLHVPGIPAREDLLYQTVHGQKLVQSLEGAIPLRSRRGPDPFAQPHWAALTRNLGQPGWIASMPPAQRPAVIEALRSFLRQYGVRWVVVVGSYPVLGADGRSVVANPVLDASSYQAFRENMWLLGPVREREVDGDTLFEFGP